MKKKQYFNTHPVWVVKEAEQYAHVYTSMISANKSIQDGGVLVARYESGELEQCRANKKWHGYTNITWE